MKKRRGVNDDRGTLDSETILKLCLTGMLLVVGILGTGFLVMTVTY